MFINTYIYIYIYIHIYIYYTLYDVCTYTYILYICIYIYIIHNVSVYIYTQYIHISYSMCIYIYICIYITAYNIYIYCYMVLYALEYVCVNDIIQHICCVWYTSILHAHGYPPMHKCMHSVVYGSYTDTYVCACTDKYIRTQSAKHAAIWWLLAIFQVWQTVIS